MSIFGSIMDRIFHAGEAAVDKAVSPAQAAPPAAPQAATAAPAAPAPTPAASSAAASPAQPVDVEAVLATMAAQKNGGGNWQSSIVDLLKLLDLDSSLDARRQLAQELAVHAGVDGSAEQNIALHKAVMQKLAANGGKVPANLMG